METINIDYSILTYLVLTTDTEEENITIEDLN
jgi:hypothetical protein